MEVGVGMGKNNSLHFCTWQFYSPFCFPGLILSPFWSRGWSKRLEKCGFGKESDFHKVKKHA